MTGAADQQRLRSVLVEAGKLLLFAVLGVFLFYAVERNDARILRHYTSGQPIDISSDAPETTFSTDEIRLAARLLSDTIPQLMRKGLVKKYVRTDIGTLLTVRGSVWAARSRFFTGSLLTQIKVYNRVHCRAMWTRVVDDDTGRVYAEILPSEQIVYDD